MTAWVPATRAVSNCKEQGTRGMEAAFNLNAVWFAIQFALGMYNRLIGPVASSILEFLVFVSYLVCNIYSVLFKLFWA